MGNWLAGCDICQEVCPHNRPRPSIDNAPHHQRYTPRPPAPALNLLDVLNWTAVDRQQAFIGSALKRMKLEMVKRNAVIAAGNYLKDNTNAPMLEKLRELSMDFNESEMVRHTDKDVVKRLESKPID